MSAADLATMTTFEFNMKCEGFKILKDREQDNFRILAFKMLSPKLKKGAKLDDVWERPQEITDVRHRLRANNKHLDLVAKKYLEIKAIRLLRAQQQIE